MLNGVKSMWVVFWIRWDVYVSSVPGRSAKANGCHAVSGSAEHREEGSAVFC